MKQKVYYDCPFSQDAKFDLVANIQNIFKTYLMEQFY